jgi:hypothetical protein
LQGLRKSLANATRGAKNQGAKTVWEAVHGVVAEG